MVFWNWIQLPGRGSLHKTEGNWNEHCESFWLLFDYSRILWLVHGFISRWHLAILPQLDRHRFRCHGTLGRVFENGVICISGTEHSRPPRYAELFFCVDVFENLALFAFTTGIHSLLRKVFFTHTQSVIPFCRAAKIRNDEEVARFFFLSKVLRAYVCRSRSRFGLFRGWI